MTSETRIGELAAFASVPVVLVLGNSMLVPVLPDIERHLGVTRFQASLVITLFSLAAGLSIPVVGYLSDRFSRKKVLLAALGLYGVSGVVAGFGALWGSYPVLIAARALQGIGAAGTAPVAMAMIGDRYEGAAESKALGLVEASNGTGKVLSPILGSLFALIVWHAVFFAFPAFCAIAVGLVWLQIKDKQAPTPPPPLGRYVADIRRVFREKGRWLTAAIFAGALGLFVLFGVLFYLSDVLEKPPHNIDGIRKGLVLAVPLLGSVTASYLTGARIRKNGKRMRMLMLTGLALSSAALATAVALYARLYPLIALLSLCGVGIGMLLPCLNTLITGAVGRDERGLITSIYNGLRFLGVALGPPLFERMMAVSHRTVFVATALLSAAALALVFFRIRPDRQVE